MNNDLEFIKEEKEDIGKVFVDINYAIDNVSPFLDKQVLNRRKYYIKKEVLKKYIDMLNSSEIDSSKKKSFFSSLFKDNSSLNKLHAYKDEHREDFTQLKNCSKCACLNCVKDCEFNTCLGCRPGSFIKKCDKEKINITCHENWVLDLTNNNTGKQNKYKVLATMQDCELDEQYIILQNIMDSNDKFILRYYPGISEDEYGEITDTQEFDFIVETFEGRDL